MNVPGTARGWQPPPERPEACALKLQRIPGCCLVPQARTQDRFRSAIFDQIEDRFVLIGFMVMLSTQSVVMHNDSCTPRRSHDSRLVYGPGGGVVVNIRSMS